MVINGINVHEFSDLCVFNFIFLFLMPMTANIDGSEFLIFILMVPMHRLIFYNRHENNKYQ